jgi:hypothetical protein
MVASSACVINSLSLVICTGVLEQAVAARPSERMMRVVVSEDLCYTGILIPPCGVECSDLHCLF